MNEEEIKKKIKELENDEYSLLDDLAFVYEEKKKYEKMLEESTPKT